MNFIEEHKVEELSPDTDIQFKTGCPYTTQVVVAIDQKTVPIPGGSALWWQCSNCEDWHVKLIMPTDAFLK